VCVRRQNEGGSRMGQTGHEWFLTRRLGVSRWGLIMMASPLLYTFEIFHKMFLQNKFWVES
jgi:hypothetical protein